MSLHCGFLFPKKDFKLIFMNTIGYISDNVFYRVNLQTLQTQIVHHPQGRSYQAFTACSKRQLVVLVDYGKNPTFYFEYHDKNKSFDMKNICSLQVSRVQLSLNAKYLAIVCGHPTPQMIFFDIENRRLLKGTRSAINLQQNYNQIKRIQFNPGNPRQIAIQFHNKIQIYQLKQCYQLDNAENLNQSVLVKKIDTIVDSQIQTFIWDEINNLYISNKKQVYIYSTDTKIRILSCDIQLDIDTDIVVANIVLTRKHVIIFYKNGRIQWLNKYYPEAMEQEDITLRPFYLDKFYQTNKEVTFSSYDGQFSKIFITFTQGCFGILPKAAQNNDAQEQQDQNGKKQNKNNTQKKIDLDMIMSPYYHASPIVLIHQFHNTAACVTLSSAGRFILWSVKSKKQLQTHAIKGNITSASVNKAGNVLATGHLDGVLRFYSIAKPNDIFLFKQLKIIKNGQIDKIIFSTNGDQLAILSKSQNKIYYMVTSLDFEFKVLGYLQIPYPIKNIAWSGPTKSNIVAKYQYLLVSLGFGVLMINSPTPTPNTKRGKQLDLKLDIYALRTDANQYLVASLPSGQLVTTGKDKYFKKYKQPQDLISKIDWKSKVPPNPPLQQIEAHDFQVQLLQNSQHYFISGGKQGKIQLRDYNNFKDLKQIKAYGWKNSYLNYVVASWNRGLIYTAGKDGSFYMWKVGDWQVKGQDKIQLSVPNFKRINPSSQVKYFIEQIQNQFLQKNRQQIDKKRNIKIQKLNKIRQQLKKLLKQNQQHQELQRLSRDQFAIDQVTKTKIQKQGQQICKKIIQQSKKKILISQIYAKKLKQITWDRMDTHLSAINGLKNNYVVYNYQVRKISQLEKRKIKLILDLRKSQKRQQKKRLTKIIDFDQYKNKNIINGGYVTPLVMTQIQAKKEDNKKDDKKKKKQDQPAQATAQQQQSVQQIPAQQEWSLLYSSFQLYNTNSKRNQIIMMKNIITIIKKTFNKEFTKLLKLRQNQNQMINDKNKRIIQICQQLKKQNQIVIPRDNILQSNDNVLEVKLAEIPFQRYLSKEERQKLEKERLKQQERLRKLAQDDSAQRALQKMMGGTLQQKKVSALQITVQKQKWMQKPVQQMNQQQKIKLKQYEQKKQKAQQQKQRIVKKLQAQLRKLKLQIDEIMQKYDQKLFQLLKKKLQYDYRIQQQQLYCARIALTLLDQEEENKRYKEVQKYITQSKNKLEAIQQTKANLANHSQEFEQLKQQKKQTLQKQRLGQFQSKIKTIQKTIFDQYQTNVKKRRQFQEKLLQSYPTFKNLIISLDPFKDIQSRYLSQTIQKQYSYFVPQIKALQQTFDIPQNTIQKLLQNRFNLRREQHQLQQRLTILSSSIQNLQESLEQNNKSLIKNQQELVSINQFLIKCKSDLDIAIRIKQGQLEINNQKPVPDLQAALLIAKSQIDQKNTKIKQQANQKIAVMKQIKTCKIKVTQQTLNLQKKQQHIDKLSSMIKQIQMLKVKKQMQVALSKKDAKMNQNQLKSLKQQIQKVRKQGEKRISLFQQKIKKIMKQIDTIKKQNKQLQTQKWNLETTVKQRQKIKDMMCGDGQSGQQAAQKFNQISINRQLFDKAKQQTQQIQLLRQQLSKLKAKTFANFSNVQR